MPVHVIHGRKRGPRLFVCAAIHGDEINGVEIIRRLLQLKLLENLRGALLAIPIANVLGFINRTRYLPDRRDLNRSFPGSASGSLAARLARLFMDEIIGQFTHGIDLHTGSFHRLNLPQIRACLDDPETERLARAFGAHIEKDDVLDTVADPFGEKEVTVLAPYPGVVIGRLSMPLVHSGDAIFHLAVVDRSIAKVNLLEALESGLVVEELDEDRII